MAHDPSADDAALFAALMQDVQRLPPTGRVLAHPSVASMRRSPSCSPSFPAAALSDGDMGLADSAESRMSFVRGGLQKNALRRLRRATVEAELDLHGLTRDGARDAVVRFVADCQSRGLRCVCMVTGKGFGSPEGQGVLRRLLPVWLRQLAQVLAFCSAPVFYGGEGAWLVWLAAQK